jgi:hypothetical protein
VCDPAAAGRSSALDADGEGGGLVLAVEPDRVQHAVEVRVDRQVLQPVSVRLRAAMPASMSWPVVRRSMRPSGRSSSGAEAGSPGRPQVPPAVPALGRDRWATTRSSGSTLTESSAHAV